MMACFGVLYYNHVKRSIQKEQARKVAYVPFEGSKNQLTIWTEQNHLILLFFKLHLFHTNHSTLYLCYFLLQQLVLRVPLMIVKGILYEGDYGLKLVFVQNKGF